MRNKIWKKVLAGALVFSLVLQGGIPAPSVRAEETETKEEPGGTEESEETEKNAVSFRELDYDIMLGTTVNSKFKTDKIAEKMDLAATLAGKSFQTTTTNIDPTDLSNWYVYDHYDSYCYNSEAEWRTNTGYNPALRPYYPYVPKGASFVSTSKMTVEKALEASKNSTSGNVYHLREHIAAAAEDGEAAMKFYGYGDKPYADFLFYPATEAGTKKVEYTVNAQDVKTHSMRKAGFLFNCGVEDGKLSGYAMILTFMDGDTENSYVDGNVCTKGIESVSVYKIEEIPVGLLHENSFSFQSSYVKEIVEAKKELGETIAFEGHYDISKINMEITNSSLKVWMTEAGAQASAGNPGVTDLVDFSNLAPTGFGGFGPIVAYESHGCEYTSSYIYSDLKMNIETADSVLSGLEDTDFTEQTVGDDGEYKENKKYFVLIGDPEKNEEGKYKDFFKRDYDDVYLEMLKKQGVILITNLNIRGTNIDVNGTDYNLEDYLGAGNVIHVDGNSEEKLAEEIKKAIVNAQYSETAADGAQNALDKTGHNDHAAARCIVRYDGKQVDSVNLSRVGSGSVKLDIDNSMSINTTDAVIELRRPDNSKEILRGKEIVIKGTESWLPGEYTVTVRYKKEGVSASTVFSITGEYNCYFNGTTAPEGQEKDNLSCSDDTVGLGILKPRQKYETKLKADKGYRLPARIEVKTDGLATPTTIDEDGVVRDLNGDEVSFKTLTAGTDYTYNQATGEIQVSQSRVTGNLYINADTVNVSYELENLTAAGPNAISSYDANDLTVDLNPIQSTFPYPAKVTVVIGDSEYVIAKDETKNIGKGVISYLGNRLTITRPLYTGDITIKAVAGNFHVYYNSDADGILGGTETTEITCGEDYDNVIEMEKGHVIFSASAALGQEKDAEGNPLQSPASFSLDPETGRLHIDGEDITDDIYINIETGIKAYMVTDEVVNVEFEGKKYCVSNKDYRAALQAEPGYALPDTIDVTIGGETTDGYTYDEENGKVVISKNALQGDVVVAAEGIVVDYPVRTDVEQLDYQGAESGNVIREYKGTLSPRNGYVLPDSVVVTIGGEEAGPESYSYDASNGEVVIHKGKITDEVLIQASATKIINPPEYKVEYRLTNLKTNGAGTVLDGKDYEAVLTPDTGCTLPASVTVTARGKLLQPGSDYEYNAASGALAIPTKSIVGDLVVEAVGTPVVNQPDTTKMTVIPPKYEDSYDGKVIGVTRDMEYSVDGGKTWIRCKGTRITGLGVGKLSIRFTSNGKKNVNPIANIKLDSATKEYYIPSISMSKVMARKSKFRLMIKNTKGAAVRVSSSNPSVVKVNKKGVIKSKKKTGKAKVVVTIIKGKHIVQYVAKVRVVKHVEKNYSLSKFKTSYKAPTIALYKKIIRGKKWKIKMAYTKHAKVTFKSSDKSVATVSKKGVVKGKKNGKSKLTVTVKNEGVTDRYYVVLRVCRDGEETDTSYLKVLK